MDKIMKFLDDVTKGAIAVIFYVLLVLVMIITAPYVYGKKVYQWLKDQKEKRLHKS